MTYAGALTEFRKVVDEPEKLSALLKKWQGRRKGKQGPFVAAVTMLLEKMEARDDEFPLFVQDFETWLVSRVKEKGILEHDDEPIKA